MWGGVADIINCAKFSDNPSKGFGAVRPPKTAFPIENVHRPYNSVGTTVPHCDLYLQIPAINCRYLQIWIKCENGLPYIIAMLQNSKLTCI